MRRAIPILLMAALACGTAAAMDLTPIVKNGQLGAVVRVVKLPASFEKDLVSGLTNTFLLRFGLISQSQAAQERTAEIAIKYDLWGENFAVTVTVNKKAAGVKTFSTVREIEAFLGSIKLTDLFAAGELPTNETFTLRLEMLLNPIERERIDAIKRWVAKNSTYTPADTPGYSDKRVGNSRANAIFNKIFEEYAYGMDVAAIWKDAAHSKPFKIEEVGDDR